MNIKNNFIESIGNTPLIKLNYPSKITGCNIYGKAEFLNPGGSIKDRAAKAIILDAIKDGKLKVCAEKCGAEYDPFKSQFV